MLESLQHKLDRVRRPRVQITYDVEIGSAIQMKELPFVVGILADLSGISEKSLSKLKERKFVEIDRDNFTTVMESIRPKLSYQVDNYLTNDNSKLNIDLVFKSLDHFSPLQVVKQIPVLTKLYESRTRLKDLLAKIDGNDVLDELLKEVLNSTEKVNALKSELGLGNESSKSSIKTEKSVSSKSGSRKNSEEKEDQQNRLITMDILIKEGKIARDESQHTFANALVCEFVRQILEQGNVIINDTVAFINQRIQQIDDLISIQLNAVIHDPSFQKLEGSWRGLAYLVFNTETGTNLKLRLLNISKKDLLSDLEKAVDFDQSQLFKKIYEEEYGTFGGYPYSCLIGDYEFTRNPQDFELLEKISQVAAAAHAPFISAAHPRLFDLDSFEQMSTPRDLSKIFESTELVKWNSFRDSEDSRYVSLVLPRVLMRLPYGMDTQPAEGLHFEEDVAGAVSRKFCWGNAAYVLGQRITNAFSHYGWTAAIRGVEGGGLVEDLPTYTFKTTDGDIALKCPTETAITDRREKELGDLGFIALCHCKGTDYAAFFGGQTNQRPKIYNLDDANSNANLSARLPYILAASRFAHYLKVIMRDKIGSFLTKESVALYLNNWIANYVLLNDDAPQGLKAKYPLRQARVDVFDVVGKPGSYQAVVYLRPHFQMEELTASIRLVATLPPPARQ